MKNSFYRRESGISSLNFEPEGEGNCGLLQCCGYTASSTSEIFEYKDGV